MSQAARFYRRPVALLAICMVLSVLCSGCVRRRLLVRTNPPGASVYVDKQLIGTTPTASSFTYYGTREIEVIADGYRTERVLRTISPRWYQIPPFDFFSETLWPWELRDERIVDIALVPEQRLASEVLLARADNLRLQSSQGIATPISPLPPTQAIELPSSSGPVLPPNSGFDNSPPPNSPGWFPGQILQDLALPGGQLPRRIPEAGPLPGGSYRPEIESFQP